MFKDIPIEQEILKHKLIRISNGSQMKLFCSKKGNKIAETIFKGSERL
jgi:hypothetical protein